MTEVEALQAARELAWAAINETKEAEGRGGYDGTGRLAHLARVTTELDRMIRERDEAYT